MMIIQLTWSTDWVTADLLREWVTASNVKCLLPYTYHLFKTSRHSFSTEMLYNVVIVVYWFVLWVLWLLLLLPACCCPPAKKCVVYSLRRQKDFREKSFILTTLVSFLLAQQPRLDYPNSGLILKAQSTLQLFNVYSKRVCEWVLHDIMSSFLLALLSVALMLTTQSQQNVVLLLLCFA